MDFYDRLGVADRIQFHKQFVFMEPGGRTSTLAAGFLPAPLHFTGSFLKLTFLEWDDKVAVAKGLLAIRSESRWRKDLDRITMLDWLVEKKQTKLAIDRFWGQVLVSAINEEPGRMAASHGFQVFRLGFLGKKNSYEMGIPSIPLGELYGAKLWAKNPNVKLHLRAAVDRLLLGKRHMSGVIVEGAPKMADAYVCALPFERIGPIAPGFDLDFKAFEHSPITGVHLWFDRTITDLPHATLLDRTIQWMFNKDQGRYVQVVISASRSLTDMPRQKVIELAVEELAEFFPLVRDAKLEKAHVVKEVRATFSAKPGLEELRPVAETKYGNLFLAGDWTRSGWPATMEGAVRSGYLAAEAVTKAAGAPQKFLVPEVG